MFKAHYLAWVCLLIPVAAHAQVLSVPGTTSPPSTASAEVRALLTSTERAQSLVIVLPEVTPQELNVLRAEGKGSPLQIGFPRKISAAQTAALGFRGLVWKALPAGLASSAVIRSPGAVAIRAALQISSVPDGAEIRFFGLKDGKVYEPLTATTLRGHDSETWLWSPVVEGDAIGIEWFVPNDVAIDGLAIAIPEISHLLGSVMAGLDELNKLKASGSCEVDLACQASTWGETAKAVARIIFTVGGSSYLCTGTLLNDTDASTFIPYFLTADHCVSTAASAATINSYFFYQRPSCGSGVPSSTVQLTGGAALLSHARDTDYSFLRLNNAAPAGASLAGWSSATAAIDLPVVGIHHPAGDYKKISFGYVDGFYSWYGTVPNSHILMSWYSGVTEGGSSGSGLWNNATWPNQYLIGILTGGLSFCSAPFDPDLYGRFDLFYSAIQPYLAPAPVVTPPLAPTLVAPLNTTTTPTPTFQWNAQSNATGYDLWVDDSTGNKLHQLYTAAQVGCAAGTGTCALTPSITLAPGTASFWVRGSNTAGFGAWSSQGAFTVQASVAANVLSLWPVGTVAPTGVARLWANVQSTGSAALPANTRVWFFVNGPNWVGDNWVGSADAAGVGPTLTSWRYFDWTVPAGATPGTYTLWARVYTPGVAISEWSSALTFTVSAPVLPSAVVDSVYPVNGGTVARSGSAVLWARVSNTSSVPLPAGTVVWFWVNGPGWTGSNWVGGTLTTGLGAGAREWYAFTWAVPAGATTGTYTYWAQVWTTGAISPWSVGQPFLVTP